MSNPLHALGAVLCLSSVALAGGSNLIPNGNFEENALTCGVQGAVPSPWSSPGADTYSSNCACQAGLDPFFPFQNFASGFQAYEGCRFAAGWGIAGEWLSVRLSTALVPGRSYRLRGAFSRSLSHTAGDPYNVYFSADATLDRAADFLAGVIGQNTVQRAWRTDALEFTATGNQVYFFLDPALGKDCYIGVDDLVLEPLASTSTRNGRGVNPIWYTSSTPPVLGGTWMAQVDTTAHPGANLTILVFYAAPASGFFLRSGELLVNVSSPLVFQIGRAPVAGLATYSVGVPNDASLACATAYSQAVVLGGGLRLCNAVDLVVGF